MTRRSADTPVRSKARRGSTSQRRASTKHSTSTARPVSTEGRSAGSTLRRLLAWLRGVVITLGLVSAISFIPVSVTAEWPETGQRAMAITREVRVLLVDVGNALITASADWLSNSGPVLLERGEDLVRDALALASDSDLGIRLPSLGDLLPDPKALFGDFIGGLVDDLLGDWWPQPTLPAGGGDLPHVAGSFANAKDLLYDRVYRRHRVTAYCGCSYKRRRNIDLSSCGLERYASNERARRVEAEHVFPAAQFGNFRRCWREPASYRACREDNGELMSGRDCCLRVDESFVVAHNDLHNLIPAVGMINGDRRDYRWGMAPDGERYGDCGIRIDANGRRAQPPDALRGDIARIMLYMDDTYGFRLSRADQQLSRAWNNLDPPDAWEVRRQERIARLQAMENDYVVRYRRL